MAVKNIFGKYMNDKKKYYLWLGAVLLVMLAAACSKTVSTEPETSSDNNTSMPATLVMVQEQVFDRSCAFSGCHAGSQPQAGMDLSAGNAYANLVNVTSKLNSNYKRVLPGNSTDSFIIKMLRNTGENTRQMPPSGKLNDNIIQLVESWIDDGAKNN